MPAEISPPFDAASLNVLAIDLKIACSCFDTDLAEHQYRTSLVQVENFAPNECKLHENGKNATHWCSRTSILTLLEILENHHEHS
ncbi:MAG: hypothetical protein V4484_11790 [Pseudomonadota bacterium]